MVLWPIQGITNSFEKCSTSWGDARRLHRTLGRPVPQGVGEHFEEGRGCHLGTVNLSRIDQPGAHVYNVVGPICETGDILGLDRLLPECEPGDVMLIANTGAYGAAMASSYNLREPAEELVLDE